MNRRTLLSNSLAAVAAIMATGFNYQPEPEPPTNPFGLKEVPMEEADYCIAWNEKGAAMADMRSIYRGRNAEQIFSGPYMPHYLRNRRIIYVKDGRKFIPIYRELQKKLGVWR